MEKMGISNILKKSLITLSGALISCAGTNAVMPNAPELSRTNCAYVHETVKCEAQSKDMRIKYFRGPNIETPEGATHVDPNSCSIVLEDSDDWYVLNDLNCDGTVDSYFGNIGQEYVSGDRTSNEELYKMDSLMRQLKVKVLGDEDED